MSQPQPWLCDFLQPMAISARGYPFKTLRDIPDGNDALFDRTDVAPLATESKLAYSMSTAVYL
jgi:hypothetical protein